MRQNPRICPLPSAASIRVESHSAIVADDELRGDANIDLPQAYSAPFKHHLVADQAIMLSTSKGHRYLIPRPERSLKPIGTVTTLLALLFDLKCQDRLIRPVDQNKICGCSTLGCIVTFRTCVPRVRWRWVPLLLELASVLVVPLDLGPGCVCTPYRVVDRLGLHRASHACEEESHPRCRTPCASSSALLLFLVDWWKTD